MMTYTFAELEVSASSYDEIAGKLRAAGYGQIVFIDGAIDMHGIGLTRGGYVSSYDAAATDPHHGGKIWNEPDISKSQSATDCHQLIENHNKNTDIEQEESGQKTGQELPSVEEALAFADGWEKGVRDAGNAEIAELMISRDAWQTKCAAERAIAICERKAVEELESRLSKAEVERDKLKRFALRAYRVGEWLSGTGFVGDPQCPEDPDDLFIELARYLGVETDEEARAVLHKEGNK